MRRMLNSEEIELNTKAISRLTEEINDMTNVELADAKLTHDYKLDYSYKKQKKQWKQIINDIETDIRGKQKNIEILEDQIKNGVEIKDGGSVPV